jgi:hypothetical protein
MRSLVDEECGELSKKTSVVLQGVMAAGWGKVLRRRVIAKREVHRSSRQRVLRKSEMIARRDLVLSGSWVYVKKSPTPVIKKKPSLKLQGSVFQPILVFSSGDDSEDEPLVRRVVKAQGFVASTFDCSDSEASFSEEEGYEPPQKEYAEESGGASETESSDSESGSGSACEGSESESVCDED